MSKSSVKPIHMVLILVLVAILAGFVGTELWKGTFDRTETRQTPEPWYYDAEHDRHWHPGHGHWHAGPPPADVGVAEPTAPAETPEPWYYDAEQDRHWHAGHGHWHPGPPPPPEQRD